MSGPWKNCQFWDVGQQFWAPWPQFGDDTRRPEISGNPTGASISIPSRLASQQLGKEFSSAGWGNIYNSKGYSTYDMATYNDLWFCSQVKEFWPKCFLEILSCLIFLERLRQSMTTDKIQNNNKLPFRFLGSLRQNMMTLQRVSPPCPPLSARQDHD